MTLFMLSGYTIFISGMALTFFLWKFFEKNQFIPNGNFMAVCFVLILVRVLLPLEFAFTRSIYVTQFFPAVTLLLKKNVITVCGYPVSLMVMLCFLWGLGIAVKGMLYLYAVICFKRKMRALPEAGKPEIKRALQKVMAGQRRGRVPRLRQADCMTTPFIAGVFRPVIVLPDITFAEDEWYYILLHEMSHYRNRDLLLKCVVEIISILFWWNPLVYKIKKCADRSLEMSNDLHIIKDLNAEQRVEYMECLLKTAKESVQLQKNTIVTLGLNGQESVLLQRFRFVAADLPRGNVKAYIYLMCMLLTVFASCFVTVENSGIEKAVAETTFSLSPETCYFIRTDAGYDLYVDDEYVASLTELAEPFTEFTIYEKEENG